MRFLRRIAPILSRVYLQQPSYLHRVTPVCSRSLTTSAETKTKDSATTPPSESTQTSAAEPEEVIDVKPENVSDMQKDAEQAQKPAEDGEKMTANANAENAKKSDEKEANTESVMSEEDEKELNDASESQSTEEMEQLLERERSQLDLANRRADQLQDKLLRSLAEVENVRQRSKREVETAYKYSIHNFAKELLEVCDNLNRACTSVKPEMLTEHAPLSALYDGVKLTDKALLQTLNKNGITVIDSLNQKFDPNFHEALFEVPTKDDAKVGLVAQVVKVGYMFNERVLRPSGVGTFKKTE